MTPNQSTLLGALVRRKCWSPGEAELVIKADFFGWTTYGNVRLPYDAPEWEADGQYSYDRGATWKDWND